MRDLRNELAEELNRRAWSMSELGRRAGISHSIISQVLAGKQEPTPDFCLAIGRALQQPERWLRLAGHLPAHTIQLDDEAQFLDAYRALTPQERDTIRRAVTGLVADARTATPRGPPLEETRERMEKKELMGNAVLNLDDPIRQLFDTLSEILNEEQFLDLFIRLFEQATENKAELGREDEQRSRSGHDESGRVVSIPRGDRMLGLG